MVKIFIPNLRNPIFLFIDLLKGEFYKVRIAAFSRYTTGAYTPWIVVKLPGERNNERVGDVDTSVTETVPREIKLLLLLFFN